MSTLRRAGVTSLSPVAVTPDLLWFLEVATRRAARLESALRPLELTAAYASLMFVLRPERSGDGNVHWRFLDMPTFEFEQGQITLPAVAGDWTSETAARVFDAVARAVLLRMAGLRGWDAAALLPVAPSDAPDDLPVAVVFDAEPPVFISAAAGRPTIRARSPTCSAITSTESCSNTTTSGLTGGWSLEGRRSTSV